MKSKFKVGDRVIGIIDINSGELVKLSTVFGSLEDTEEIRGKIYKVYSSNVDILWDNLNFRTEFPSRVNQQFLLLEKDYKAEKATLEKVFKAVERQVKIKLKRAANLVKEANKLTKKAKLEMKAMQDVWSPLLNEMDQAGWNSSNCW